jgi:TonB family protein
MTRIRLLILAGFVLVAANSARAQLPDLQVLADQMRQTVSDSKLPTVVVVDFYGSDEKFTNLGVTLADQFENDLKRTPTHDAIRRRGEMRDWLKNKGWPLNVLKSVDVALWIAGQLKVDAVIAGNISIRENEIKVEVNLFRVDTREWVKGFEATSRMSTDAATLAAVPAEPDYKFDPTIPVSGQNGYTIPKCISCPEAPYTPGAITHRAQGSVLFTAVIEADGSVGKLTVREALPDGLTEAALEAVSKWRFEPAQGPDGKAAAVQHTVRLTFHFRHERIPAKVPPPKPNR